ncbi:hypothetical protein AI2633V1_2728 [Klebsiella pneumoniae]|nr:hypothetical protein AI2633V1_2728 [Klebsiella pneumoniae]CAH3309967.1 hypothetical protein AI2633V1_2728 [Klebsiella pneumoniae]
MFNDAIVYDRYGPPAAVLTLKRLPLAPLAGGRVRVRMRFAPVNPSDLIPVTAPIATAPDCRPSPAMKALARWSPRHTAAG